MHVAVLVLATSGRVLGAVVQSFCFKAAFCTITVNYTKITHPR